MRCTNDRCKNHDKKVERWKLIDSRGYPCGTVCNYCHDIQKSMYNPVIFGDSNDYLQEMADCGENIYNY
jgi:hypothetical protein